MKLTKDNLIKKSANDLAELGYSYIKDSVTGADGLFGKVIEEEYFLTFGLTISRYYDSRFTGAFYLSKTTRWGSLWGDIPKESYQRIGQYLQKKEREAYLEKEYSKEGVVDAWWDSIDNGSFNSFFEVVKITEKRFLNQDNLFLKIERSREIHELVEQSSAVTKIIKQGDNYESEHKFIPKRKVDDIPIEWFKAAEITLQREKGILNVNTVMQLGADAWRQNLLLNIKYKQV
jgi:hypothetical protein